MSNPEITVTPVSAPEPSSPVETQSVQQVEVDPSLAENSENPPENDNDSHNEDPMFSKRFAALSRQEKILRQREADLKAQAEKYKAYEEGQSAQEKFMAEIKENPMAVLEKYNLSLDDLIQYSLGMEAPEPTTDDRVAQLQAQIEKMQQDLLSREEQAKKAQEEAAQNSIDEAIAAHKESIAQHIQTNADKYELVSAKGEDALALIWTVTEQYFENNHEVLDVATAAEHVENYLFEEGQKLLGLSKFKGLGNAESQPKVEDSTSGEPQRQIIPQKTVTQNYASARPATQQKHSLGLSPEESKRRAAKFLEEQWSKKTN